MSTRRPFNSRPPRQHHFVPRFYLGHFTATGNSDDPIYVLDVKQQKQWESTPGETAHQRDYYAVELDAGSDPMVIEKTLSKCEDKWADVVRDVHSNRSLPANDAMGDLLAFVSFAAVRIPFFRNRQVDLMGQVSKAELRATFSTEEGRRTARAAIEDHLANLSPRARKSAQDRLNGDPELDELARFAMSGDYEISVDQTWCVQSMVRSAISLLSVLERRRWVLRPVASEAPDLICSDNPVCLTWIDSVRSPYPPGYELTKTLLTIPLGRRLMLASTFEELPELAALTSAKVAQMNFRTAANASQVFSSEPDFTWMMPDGRIGNAAGFLEFACRESIDSSQT